MAHYVNPETGLQPVKLLRKYAQYRSGDIVGLKPDTACALIREGYAQAVKKPEEKKP